MTRSMSAPARAKESSQTKASAIAISVVWLAAIGVLGVGMTSACASSPHRAAVTADRELARRANEALAQAAEAAAASATGAAGEANRIEVTCYRGVASLLGESSQPAAQVAERIVRDVPGVVRVNNLLISNQGPSATSGSARSEKAPITARATDAAPGGR